MQKTENDVNVIGYFENNKPDTYAEGPFILCNVFGEQSCRIEVELKGHYCSVLPDASISELLESATDWQSGRRPLKYLEPYVIWLNERVVDGTIVCEDGWWVWNQ